MNDELNAQDLYAHRARLIHDSETVIVEDDVEAHGMLGVVGAVVIMAGGAGGAFVANTGTALAPEPARLTQDLGGSSGTTAAAYYTNTNVNTSVVRWPSTYAYSPTLPAGTPCSPYELPAGTESTRVIQATGNYRKCL